MKRNHVFSLIILAVIALSSIVFYPVMPEKMASHWNGAGIADGFTSKAGALAIIPIIAIACFSILIFLPRLDPLKKNFKAFESAYEKFVVTFLIFMLYLHFLILAANAGVALNMVQWLVPAFAFLSFMIGWLLPQVKRNYFVGIRTPWTLHSDEVWNETHKRGGNLFMFAGIVTLIGIFVPKFAIWFILVPLVGVAIYTLAYSYFVWKRKKRN